VSAAIAVACESEGPAPAPSGALPPMGPAVTFMLDGLSTYITQALQENQASLPSNPQSASFIQAKIAMLQTPGLASQISNGGRWASAQALSSHNRPVSIGCVFALEAMRGDANDAVKTIEATLPVLETFLDIPIPVSVVRVWYGFVIGNSGGGGSIYTEDRATYEARTPPTRSPHDAILGHELGHSFISHESLTQFLEMYAWNVTRNRGTDPLQWTFTRGWTPGLATNQDSAALLDVYQLIGHDAMRQAFRAIRPLRPEYGQPLSPAVIQAFIAQVPEALQSQVAEKLARVNS
jgi:hypothetical protein